MIQKSGKGACQTEVTCAPACVLLGIAAPDPQVSKRIGRLQHLTGQRHTITNMCIYEGEIEQSTFVIKYLVDYQPPRVRAMLLLSSPLLGV